MRIFATLLALATVNIAQYLPVDNAKQLEQFDCSSRSDGNYAIGECSGGYVHCVAGLAYSVGCQEGLVYLDSSDRCEYLSFCSERKLAETPIKASTTSAFSASIGDYEPNNGYHDDGHQENLIDCSHLPDGFYSPGCTPYYTICSFGISTKVACAAGLLFYQPSGTCEWPSLCLSSGTTPSAVQMQQPLKPTVASFDCSRRQDGDYSLGCVNAYVQCINGAVVMRSCPESLVFDEVADQCREQCGVSEISTVPPIVSSSPNSTSRRKCVGAEVSAYGECSSKFKRCRNAIWTGALCPGATVFDANLGLCVYDLPVCKTDIFNPAIPTSPVIYVSSHSYNGIAQSDLPYISQADVVPYAEGQLESQFAPAESDHISNPFFALRHKNRKQRKHRKHHHQRDFEERTNTGKLRYSSRSTLIDDRSHRVDDGLDGKAEHYIQQNYRPTFPRSYKNKHTALKNVWDDGSKYNELEEPRLVVDGKDKALVEELVDLDLNEGSGAIPGDEIKRKRRSYSLNAPISVDNICFNRLEGAILPMGSCRQDFIVCSKSGTQIRAACAVGDLFDTDAKLCVLQGNCEEKPFSTSGVSESATRASEIPQRVDKLSVVDPCEGRANGPLSLGCSVSYVICQNNVGHEMVCPGKLVFDEARNICDHRENVLVCGGAKGDSPFAGSSRPVALQYSSDNVAADLGSSEVYRSTYKSIPTEIPSSPSAYRPVFSTPKPYMTITRAPSVYNIYPSTVAYKSHNGFCAELPAGYHQTQLCSNSFVYCSGERQKDVLMSCPVNLVYSSEANQCQEKEKVRGCAEYSNLGFLPVTEALRLPVYGVDSARKSVDSSKQNKNILELSTKSKSVQDYKMYSACMGFEHGAHIADKEECTVYYRCVWDRLEKMRCPTGTVYNPDLSVCDEASNVPSCQNYTP